MCLLALPNYVLCRLFFMLYCKQSKMDPRRYHVATFVRFKAAISATTLYTIWQSRPFLLPVLPLGRNFLRRSMVEHRLTTSVPVSNSFIELDFIELDAGHCALPGCSDYQPIKERNYDDFHWSR